MKKAEREEFKAFTEDLLNQGKEYVDIQKELIQLEATERAAKYAGRILAGSVLSLLTYLVVMFASFGLAFYLGSIYNSLWIGFAWVTGGYAVLLLILFVFRKPLLRVPFINHVIKTLIHP
ncbi:phage holin family protein [Halocola ammonii]